MISNSMIANREYVDTLYHFSSQIDRELLVSAELYYGIPMTDSQKLSLFSMKLRHKQWLLQEYKQEIEYAPADFDNIY
jgi:hypothetical protein